MNSKFRLFTAIVALTAAIALSLVCGTRESQAQSPIEVTFWHAMSKARGEKLNSLVQRFNKQNPSIKVTATFVGAKGGRGNDYNALYTNLLEQLARTTPPDIAQVYENWTTQFIEIGALTPVDTFFNGPDGLDQASINDFVDIFRKANTFTSPSGEQHIYTLPFNKSIYVLFYNKAVFQELGLTPPKTWDEMRKVAKTISTKKGIPGLAFAPNVDIFGHYLYTNGGEYFQNGKVSFGGALGVKDLNYWVTLVHNDRSATPTFDARKMFSDGKAGMYMESTSNIGNFEKNPNLKFGVVPIPRGTTMSYQFAGTNLAIFKKDTGDSTADQGRQKAAWKFIRFMTSPEITTEFATATGYLPVRKSAVNGPVYKNYIKQHPNYQVGINSLQYASVQPRVGCWETVRGILDDTLIEALGRKNTPEDAMLRATSMANGMLMSAAGNQ
ncbi:MAG: ABC transporter substrate-binding protein [bacterium]|nr:ABC transporter substrate-binding protein [bacterium]